MLIIVNDGMSALWALEKPMPPVVVATTSDDGIVINVSARLDHR
jgi:hypothetical protein